MIGGLDLGHVAMARVKGGRGHHDHRHIDDAGDASATRTSMLEMAISLRRRRRRATGARACVRPECR